MREIKINFVAVTANNIAITAAALDIAVVVAGATKFKHFGKP